MLLPLYNLAFQIRTLRLTPVTMLRRIRPRPKDTLSLALTLQLLRLPVLAR